MGTTDSRMTRPSLQSVDDWVHARYPYREMSKLTGNYCTNHCKDFTGRRNTRCLVCCIDNVDKELNKLDPIWHGPIEGFKMSDRSIRDNKFMIILLFVMVTALLMWLATKK